MRQSVNIGGEPSLHFQETPESMLLKYVIFQCKHNNYYYKKLYKPEKMF